MSAICAGMSLVALAVCGCKGKNVCVERAYIGSAHDHTHGDVVLNARVLGGQHYVAIDANHAMSQTSTVAMSILTGIAMVKTMVSGAGYRRLKARRSPAPDTMGLSVEDMMAGLRAATPGIGVVKRSVKTGEGGDNRHDRTEALRQSRGPVQAVLYTN